MPISLMWVLVGVLTFAWLVLIVAAAWLVVTPPGHHPTVPTDRGRVILADRFARGEIDAEEFRERMGNPPETVSRR
jgi:uncharacterized membrane protein